MATDDDENRKVEHFLKLCNFSCDFLPEELKTHFSYLCQITAKQANKTLPHVLKDEQFICKYCFTQFNATNCHVEILPEIKPGKAMRRILSKVKRNKKLSTVEKKLAMRVHSGNYLVIKCLICKNKTKKKVNKPKIAEIEPEPVETPKLPAKKKKKRKKKRLLLELSNVETSESVTIDLTDETPQNASRDFIPLEASTPFPKTQNPLMLTKRVNKSANNKKRQSLKKLLEEESSPKRFKSFKDFANMK